MKMRGIKYWGKIWGETEGIILLLTLFLYLFTGMDFEFLGKGGVTESIFSLLAWYLVISGAFVVFIITASCFQQYLPMAVAFGATRKNAAAGALPPALSPWQPRRCCGSWRGTMWPGRGFICWALWREDCWR